MNNKFHYANFFDNTNVFKELFEKSENTWEVLNNIDEFINGFGKVHESKGFKKIREGLYFGQEVLIDDSVKIDGSAIIGHNTTLGHASYLRGSVLISDNVNVGHATEVKHSIILSHTALAHLNYVGDSILGSNINLSGGATLANWRFDKKDILIKDKDIEIPTYMEKFGAVIGDDSFIGVNAVLNPGTILFKKTLVYPLTSVKGVHDEAEVIK